jgi:hypothetical protein
MPGVFVFEQLGLKPVPSFLRLHPPIISVYNSVPLSGFPKKRARRFVLVRPDSSFGRALSKLRRSEK